MKEELRIQQVEVIDSMILSAKNEEKRIALATQQHQEWKAHVDKKAYELGTAVDWNKHERTPIYPVTVGQKWKEKGFPFIEIEIRNCEDNYKIEVMIYYFKWPKSRVDTLSLNDIISDFTLIHDPRRNRK
jgi:hypothetical protein